MDRIVRIGGQYFSKELFDFFMTGFKESFSHGSLSIESAFVELEDCEAELNQMRDCHAYEYYKLLESKDRRKIDAYLRRFIVYRGYQVGILMGKFDVNCPQRDVDYLFGLHFKYMAKDMHYFIKFREDGSFDERATFSAIGEMFRLSFEKKNAEDKAYNMQKDHMDAFDYAMSLSHIGVPEIIKINSCVNHSRPEREDGFKHTNNIIFGADFEVSDKTSVPVEMQRLLSEYQNNFGLEVLDYNDPRLSYHERNKRLLKLFEREAIFHIRFERIHPFSDGNGRTGRIIMNKHLIEAGMAPVLITDFMTEEYKRYISNYDYEGLAKMMLASSSQLLSNWVSMKKAGVRPRKVEPTNERLAVLTSAPQKMKFYKYYL